MNSCHGNGGACESAYPAQPAREDFERFVDLAKSDPATAVRTVEKHPHIVRWIDGVTEESLFHFLVVERAAEVLPALARAGAEINRVHPTSGRTALEDAVVCGDERVLRTLLGLGVTRNAQGASGQTALSLAVSMQRNGLLVALLEAGWDPNLTDGRGWTPLHEAVLHENYEAYRLLVERGADQDRANDSGLSPRDHLQTQMELRGPFM